ncbi:hypothetical protein [Spongiimicrobium sp. 2-473A-2-J]|uniref:hypothetical protein n=1 Tax=Eudoraea algarum TaxID=3417568 RepID=UPI003D361DC4
MKKIVLCVLILGAWSGLQAQKGYFFEWDNYQKIDNISGTEGAEINLPNRGTAVLMGGLNDLDGAGNYLNIYGSKLIVERMDRGSSGVIHVVLRREDGRTFFNLFPTIRAKLTPMEQQDVGNTGLFP